MNTNISNDLEWVLEFLSDRQKRIEIAMNDYDLNEIQIEIYASIFNELADIIDSIKRRINKDLSINHIRDTAIKDCMKIAEKYADAPVGVPLINNSYDAWKNGMNYTTGGTDNASAIHEALFHMLSGENKV